MTVAISAEVAAFLKQPITACLATLYPDGNPHLTYVWYEFTGNSFRISTDAGWVKTKHLMNDDRAALSILDPENPYRWLTFNGRVAITKAGADDLIMRVSMHYLGNDKGKPYAANMQGPDRVVLTLTPKRLISRGFV